LKAGAEFIAGRVQFFFFFFFFFFSALCGWVHWSGPSSIYVATASVQVRVQVMTLSDAFMALSSGPGAVVGFVCNPLSIN
jgi:hypothetical protein